MVIFFGCRPNLIKSLVHAIAEAPAPLTTIFIFLIFFFAISKALIKAAEVMIAVPCWSS